MQNKKISIIIPCYNEEKVIDKTYDRVLKVLTENKYNYEILFIDDGSNDKTFEIIKDFSNDNKNVKIITFSRNFGHQAGVTAGLKNCTGDLAIIIDADLQDPPELFPQMIELCQKEKSNIVYGVRKSRKKESPFKKITALIFYRFLNFLSDVKLPLDTGDFRLVDKKVINAFKSLNENNKYIRGLFSWIGFKQIPIYYDRDPREYGKTKYSLTKMFKLATTGIFYFSKKPLKISLSLGLFCILISLGFIIYVLFSKFFDPAQTIKGWSSTLIIIIFFGGIQLFMIGILGEYLGNIFDEVKKRPEYIINEKINFKVNNKD